jgi:hypothetical protein
MSAAEAKPVKLWSWPKIIFLYPSVIAAVLAAVASGLFPDRETAWGTVFLLVFMLNIIVMAFDFPRTTSLNLVLAIVALVLGAILINQHVVDIFPALRATVDTVRPAANSQFYWYFAGIVGLIYLVVLVVDFRFDYWMIYPNEIIHRRGILGNVSRYPTVGLVIDKEITDIFEYFMFGSGRLIIQPQVGQPIVLDNVFRVNEKQRRIQSLLDAINVEISAPDPVPGTF